MSDDDFFDSPRGGGSPKKYSFSREETSGKVSTATGDNKSRGGVGSKVGKGSPAKGQESDSGSETERSDRPRRSKGSSNQGSVTKIPTGKSQEYTQNSTDDDYSSDEGGTGRLSRSKGKRASRSGSSRSGSSSYTGSSSRSRSRSTSPASDNGKQTGSKQAWGTESTSKSKATDGSSKRPKTGHRSRRSHRSRSPSAERKDTSKSKGHQNNDDSSSLSETESSDSDMTDVSPLNSPQRETPKRSKRVEICESPLSEKRPPHSPMHKDLYSYSGKKARPKSAHPGGYEHLLQADKDSVNLKVLMQAILEMERDKEEKADNTQRKFRVQHHAPSIAGSVSSQSSISSAKNFSFTNSRVKDIDRENQRLMRQILKQNLKRPSRQEKPKKQPMTANHRLTSSAVNRMKEQQRIDQENRSMLRRLEGAKATKTLQRDALNHELNNTTYVGVPLGVIHAPKNKTAGGYGGSAASSVYGGGPRAGSAPPGTRRRRPGSAVSHRSDASSVASNATSQMSFGSSTSTLKSKRSTGSAKPRPKSAHVMSGTRTIGGVMMKSSRPDWEAGW